MPSSPNSHDYENPYEYYGYGAPSCASHFGFSPPHPGFAHLHHPPPPYYGWQGIPPFPVSPHYIAAQAAQTYAHAQAIISAQSSMQQQWESANSRTSSPLSCGINACGGDDPRNSSSPSFPTPSHNVSHDVSHIVSQNKSPNVSPNVSPIVVPIAAPEETPEEIIPVAPTAIATPPPTTPTRPPTPVPFTVLQHSKVQGDIKEDIASSPSNTSNTPSFHPTSFRPIPIKNPKTSFSEILINEKKERSSLKINFIDSPALPRTAPPTDLVKTSELGPKVPSGPNGPTSRPSPTATFTAPLTAPPTLPPSAPTDLAPPSLPPSSSAKNSKYFFSKQETSHLLRHFSRDIQDIKSSECTCEFCDFFTKFGLHFSDFEGTKNFISSNKLFFLAFPFLTQCNPERCPSKTSEECKHPKNENSFFYVHPCHLDHASKEDLDWVNLQKTPPSNKCRRFHCWDFACKKKHHPLTRRGPKI